MGTLDGQVAVVTGGSRGIGRATAHALAAAGARVMTTGRSPRPADLPDAIHWFQSDVADPASVAALQVAAEQAIGPTTILVNNAGIQVEKTVSESSDEDWDAVIGTNCRGVFNCCRAFLPGMAETAGAVVNIGSISGNQADPAMALYNASKAFVHGLTRSIAVDHGPAVRCNAVSPGWIMTGMADAAFAMASNPAAAEADAVRRHAVRRFGQPEDIARAVVWLASPEAAFVTGQCLTVDGGLTAASPHQPGLF
ncbi:MAG: SDR family oxidoreductase [Pseudomonadota bacterium]